MHRAALAVTLGVVDEERRRLVSGEGHLNPLKDPSGTVPPVPILYEDNHILVVDKPAGLLSQGDETGDRSLLEVIADYLCVKYDKPGRAFVGLVHRLDRPVSGLLVLARTSKAASRLSEQVRERRMTKRYRAWTTARPPLGRLTSVVDGKPAALVILAVQSVAGTPLWEVLLELETGRKHQIRLQLSEIGCPIVGDVRHGGPTWQDGRAIALEAAWLSFDHPTRGERLEFALDVPLGWRA